MKSSVTVIKPLKLYFYLPFFFGLILLLPFLWGMYDLAHLQVYGLSFIPFGIVSFFAFYDCIVRHGNTITIENNALYANWLLGFEKILKLKTLRSVEHYSIWSKTGYIPVLKMTDDSGTTIKLFPKNYRQQDIDKLMTELKPFIFQPGVEKNFERLSYFISDW